MRAIAARAPSVRSAAEGEAARVLRLSVSEEADSFVARLEVSGASGAATRREIRGPSCDAVVAAMALVASLALDPLALSTPPTTEPHVIDDRPTPPPPPAPPLPPPLPSLPPPLPLQPPPRKPAVASASPLPEAPREPPVVEPNPRRARLGVGAAVEVIGLNAPNAVVSPAGFAELALDRPSLLSPSFRAGVLGGEGGNVTSSGLSATFTWVLGELEVCPIRVRVVGPVAFRPCLGGDFGRLWAAVQASGAANPSRGWADVSATARLEWRALGWLSLDAQGGLLVPLTRNQFVFEPVVTAPVGYTPPIAALAGSLGVVVFFL
jgi:hypothetical protein